MNKYFSIFAIATALIADIPLAHASPIHHYDQLRTQLFSGTPVTAIFTSAQCSTEGTSSKPAAPPPSITGGLAIRTFIEVPNTNIGFADKHFTIRPDGSPIIEFIQYRVMPDDTATVTIHILSPLTYQPLVPSKVYRCAIDNGLSFKTTPDE